MLRCDEGQVVDSLMPDPAMKGAKVALCAREFGDGGASHLVVEDFDDCGEYMDTTARRRALDPPHLIRAA